MNLIHFFTQIEPVLAKNISQSVDPNVSSFIRNIDEEKIEITIPYVANSYEYESIFSR